MLHTSPTPRYTPTPHHAINQPYTMLHTSPTPCFTPAPHQSTHQPLPLHSLQAPALHASPCTACKPLHSVQAPAQCASPCTACKPLQVSCRRTTMRAGPTPCCTPAPHHVTHQPYTMLHTSLTPCYTPALHHAIHQPHTITDHHTTPHHPGLPPKYHATRHHTMQHITTSYYTLLRHHTTHNQTVLDCTLPNCTRLLLFPYRTHSTDRSQPWLGCRAGRGGRQSVISPGVLPCASLDRRSTVQHTVSVHCRVSPLQPITNISAGDLVRDE